MNSLRSEMRLALSQGHSLLVLHGPGGTACALDLESKFAESALGTVQVADFRQFAHGRHIQLARRANAYAVLAFVGHDDLDMWVAISALLPAEIATQAITLPSGLADATLQGLLAVYSIVEGLSSMRGMDPGMPEVPEFARRIHSLEPAALVIWPEAAPCFNVKVGALRRRGLNPSAIEESAEAFIKRLGDTRFYGLALDFDGTCCETRTRLDGINGAVTAELQRLLDAGLVLAFASGRGDSLYSELRSKLHHSSWGSVVLGCHSGSTLLGLGSPWQEGPRADGLDALADQLRQAGIHQDAGYLLRLHAGQLTVEAGDPERVLKAFLRASELIHRFDGWRVFRSSHSIDVLAPEANKIKVVSAVTRLSEAARGAELLRIGDRGETYGNDSELLADSLSLSVDGVSIDPSSCWLFGSELTSASERTTAYLAAFEPVGGATCRFRRSALDGWRDEISRSVHCLRASRP